ncbi:MAG: glycosyltransferase [Saprospiraceae bacterium]
MAIPKTIFQTFKNAQLPFLTRWHIKRMKNNNKEYDYQFYDDSRVDKFIEEGYGQEVFQLFKKINIGAAKADFFRYAVLYKKGGIYLDIDSLLSKKLDTFILPTDKAIISFEKNMEFYCQWALVYEAEHPFLRKTLDIVIDNLQENKYPNNVHMMTGPGAYSYAIKECLKESSNVPFRQLGIDYEGAFKFHYRMSKFFLYGLSRKNHWKKQQMSTPLLKKD